MARGPTRILASAPTSSSQPGLGSGDTSPLSGLAPLTGLTGTGSAPIPATCSRRSVLRRATPPERRLPRGHPEARPYHPTSVADVLPLNTGQVGSQVAGLVVLALGVIIAVVRVSLRKPRTQGKQ